MSLHNNSARSRNLGVILDTNLSFAVSNSCFHNIQDPRRIRNTIHQTAVCTIATSLIQPKIDYCNFLLPRLPVLKLIVFTFSSTLPIMMSLKLLNFITLLDSLWLTHSSVTLGDRFAPQLRQHIRDFFLETMQSLAQRYLKCLCDIAGIAM